MRTKKIYAEDGQKVRQTKLNRSFDGVVRQRKRIGPGERAKCPETFSGRKPFREGVSSKSAKYTGSYRGGIGVEKNDEKGR